MIVFNDGKFEGLCNSQIVHDNSVHILNSPYNLIQPHYTELYQVTCPRHQVNAAVTEIAEIKLTEEWLLFTAVFLNPVLSFPAYLTSWQHHDILCLAHPQLAFTSQFVRVLAYFDRVVAYFQIDFQFRGCYMFYCVNFNVFVTLPSVWTRCF